MSPALEALGLGVGTRLRGVDLALPAGAMVAVTGPNGAGKSTLLQALGGLLPAAGQVRWQGQELRKIPILERGRRLAWVAQDHPVEFGFPVREVVAQGRFAWGDEATDPGVDDAIRELDLAHLAQRPATRLSGGERQRVFLARALATRAPLQLWDEPLAQLDARHALEVLRRARGLADAGGTVLLSVHDLRIAHCMDRVIVLQDGVLRAFGEPEAVLTPELILEVFGVQARRDEAWILELP